MNEYEFQLAISAPWSGHKSILMRPGETLQGDCWRISPGTPRDSSG
jgi:hypothetical protein